ncbi:hypothetical protein WOLCODRAFT_165194 [Wolfiporia cocos MD-104 SS10]|uniref:Uncharacterized protein n=1 Tax=Wolfiporia cocos (strain MD-104) TaxID=742152 RepID=A0A2H3K604_WOLCO|nr:hypothetical protein WOLCODRAFT_165194 [Wolfiporia cocos MD-104 SS10]
MPRRRERGTATHSVGWRAIRGRHVRFELRAALCGAPVGGSRDSDPRSSGGWRWDGDERRPCFAGASACVLCGQSLERVYAPAYRRRSPSPWRAWTCRVKLGFQGRRGVRA